MDKQKIGFIGALVIVAIAIVGGIVLAAKGVAVPTWLASLLAVIGPAFAWYAKPPGGGDDKPAAPKVPPLPLLLVLLVPLAGCAWLSKPSHYADTARILTCISAEAAAGKSPAEIAFKCGLENADAVIDLVTKSQGVASAAPKMAKPAASVKP
jgi:hypothetical protein